MVKKGPFLHPEIRPKGPKSFFSQTYFLQFLVKLIQERAKKSKNMAKKGIFGPKRYKKGHYDP